MNSDRIKALQLGTASPDSRSVQWALMQVWNECAQEAEKEKQEAVKSAVEARDAEIKAKLSYEEGYCERNAKSGGSHAKLEMACARMLRQLKHELFPAPEGGNNDRK